MVLILFVSYEKISDAGDPWSPRHHLCIYTPVERERGAFSMDKPHRFDTVDGNNSKKVSVNISVGKKKTKKKHCYIRYSRILLENFRNE